MATTRPRLGVLLRFVIAAYIAALAAMPFAHHDLVCHLKSSTHCATCHIGTSADPGGTQPVLAAADYADAGCPLDTLVHAAVTCVLSSSAGRAPPAIS